MTSSIAGRRLPPERLGRLRDAPSDPAAQRARFVEEGYLLLRGALPVADVLAARAEVLARLRAVGEITGTDALPIATGQSRRAELHSDLGAFWREVSEGPALHRAMHGPALHAATAALLGEITVPYDFVWLRAVTAGRASPFHFDHPYMNRGSDRLVTCWAPLGPVSLEDGPIALMQGSQRWTDLAARVQGRDVDREAGFNASFTEDMVDLVTARDSQVLSADFQPGDVLVFGMFLLHGSLDNAAPGGRVRLSCDVRYQPAGDARDDRWFGSPPKGHGDLSYGGLSAAQPLIAAPIIR